MRIGCVHSLNAALSVALIRSWLTRCFLNSSRWWQFVRLTDIQFTFLSLFRFFNSSALCSLLELTLSHFRCETWIQKSVPDRRLRLKTA